MMHAGVVLFAVVMVSTAVDDDRVTHCIKKFNLDTRSETANLVNEVLKCLENGGGVGCVGEILAAPVFFLVILVCMYINTT
ncbi:hypothetical protein Q1695_000693 [Nippostrongylus brasiliensis]|nr:hypothetical protein Q1695_000693 [Nippostrongylus brasiliensis]